MDKLTKTIGLAMLVGTFIGLSACSSKPSPWTQQSSPWASREDVAQEPVEAEPMPAEESLAANEAMMAEPEPVGMAGAMEPVEELPMEPPVMDEPEPVMEMPAEPVTQPAMAASGDIRSQPANHYAVQVVASSSMENLMNFAKVNGLSDQWTAETMVNGKTWYVLLQGIYATKAEADAALSAAQSRFDTQPWIRTVGSLQSVMTP